MKATVLNWPPVIPRVLWLRRACPRCSSVIFKPAEPEWADSLFILFRLRAVRCVNCWRRYYWFARRSSYEK